MQSTGETFTDALEVSALCSNMFSVVGSATDLVF